MMNGAREVGPRHLSRASKDGSRRLTEQTKALLGGGMGGGGVGGGG